jgi:hypothetical protein
VLAFLYRSPLIYKNLTATGGADGASKAEVTQGLNAKGQKGYGSGAGVAARYNEV